MIRPVAVAVGLLAAGWAAWALLPGLTRRLLLASDSPPPRLHAEPLEVDLGSVQAGAEREVAFAWRRAGRGALALLGTRTGCGCATLRDLPTRFAPGASGAARLTLRIPAEPGPLEVPVRIVTDAAPPHDVLTLRVRAYVGTRAVVRPGWLDLGRRSPQARVPATLEVHLPPGVERGVTWDLLAWSGEVTVLPAARAARHGPDLRLESVLGREPGPVAGALRVTTAAGDVLVPLRAEVVAATQLAAAPRSVSVPRSR